MKDFEKFLKNEGIESALNLSEDALIGLMGNWDLLVRMANYIRLTGIPYTVFSCADVRTGMKKEYYLTAELLADLMEIVVEANEKKRSCYKK